MPLIHRALPRLAVLLAFLAPILSPAAPARKPLSLLPESATGGLLVTAADGRQAVSLPASTAPDKGYAWKLSSPLAPGWWELSVEFIPLPKDSLRLKFFLGSRFQPVFDVSEAALSGKADTFHFRFCNATPVESLEVRPQRTMSETVRAIARVTFTPVEGPGAAADYAIAEAPVDTNGIVSLPPGLPSGNWQILPHFTRGRAPDTGEVCANSDGDEQIAIPQSGFMNLYTSEALHSLRWDPVPATLDGAVLRHIPPYHPALPIEVTKEVRPAVIDNRFTRVPLIFSGKSSERPSFPVFPGGARIAVVTGWDDSPKQQDLRTARLLEKYGFRGTFFTMKQAPDQKDYLAELESRGMEVASHTVNHPRGWMIAPEQWADECLQMRIRLEEAVGHPVISFAYPYNYIRSDDARGDYVLRGVRIAGYLSARTTRTGAETLDGCKEPLLLRTDGYFKHNDKNLDQAWEHVLQGPPGGIFYFWGHAWDNDSEQDWRHLEALLARYARQPGAWYATQGQVFLWKWLREHARWEDAHENAGTLKIVLTYPRLDPWLQKQIPMTVSVPAGVTHVTLEGGRTLPVENGLVTLPDDVL